MKSLTFVDTVEFQGVTVAVCQFIPPSDMNSKIQRIPKRSWHRVELELNKDTWNAETNIREWITTYATGQASLCAIDSKLIIYFSHVNDALKFKLSDLQELMTREASY